MFPIYRHKHANSLTPGILKVLNNKDLFSHNDMDETTSLLFMGVHKTNDHLVLKQYIIKYINEHEKMFKYTDGFKDSGRVVMGIYDNNLKIKIALLLNASVFTAELLSAKNAFKSIKDHRILKATILSYSLRSMQSTNAHQPQNVIVSEIRYNLHERKLQNMSVKFCRVPSHTGVEGNEKADILCQRSYITPNIRVFLASYRYQKML